MSLEKARTGDKPSRYLNGEGRGEESGQQPGTSQRSSGVSVDGMSGSDARVNWETSPRATKGATARTSRPAGEMGQALGGVGVLHSSVDLWESITHRKQREGTCIEATRRREGSSDGWDNQLPTPQKIRELQIKLYRKAKADRKWKAWSLYGEICRRDILEMALEQVIANDGAPGIDGVDARLFKYVPNKREKFLESLEAELRAKQYQASPVRRVYIKKENGKLRPLGIPTVKDRVVQSALVILLMPIGEADFHPHSYAYRPKKNAQQAMDAIKEAALQGRTEVIDADLSGYFDSIPHRPLLRLVAKRVSDGSILRLIKGWLRAPVVEATEDKRRQRVCANRQGTPQGGVISPWLANLYLNGLDHAVNEQCEQKPRLVRYADDFVIACRPGQGVKLMERTQRWLERRGLKLNGEKTRLVNLTKEGINFLGFGMTWRKGKTAKSYPHVEPNAKSQAKLRKKLGQHLNHWTLHEPVPETVQKVNRVVKGWINYFHYANSSAVFTQMQHHTRNRLRRWLWRKHGCRKGLFKHYTNERLANHYGLNPFPLWTKWRRATS